MSNTQTQPLFMGGLHLYLTNAHNEINNALKTATPEQASALILQRRELNIISAAQEREAFKAECQPAEITLTNNELKALYSVEGGEPISGAELDELNEGDQDTRAAIRAAYLGESHTSGHGAQIELYTPPTPRHVVKTSQDPLSPRYTKRHKAAILELEAGLSSSFEPAMISENARGVARVVICYGQIKPKHLEAKVAELQAKANEHNTAAERADRKARAKTRAKAKARGRRARLKAQH